MNGAERLHLLGKLVDAGEVSVGDVAIATINSVAYLLAVNTELGRLLVDHKVVTEDELITVMNGEVVKAATVTLRTAMVDELLAKVSVREVKDDDADR